MWPCKEFCQIVRIMCEYQGVQWPAVMNCDKFVSANGISDARMTTGFGDDYSCFKEEDGMKVVNAKPSMLLLFSFY